MMFPPTMILTLFESGYCGLQSIHGLFTCMYVFEIIIVKEKDRVLAWGVGCFGLVQCCLAS